MQLEQVFEGINSFFSGVAPTGYEHFTPLRRYSIVRNSIKNFLMLQFAIVRFEP